MKSLDCRQKEAIERNNRWRNLSFKEQLEELDKRPGFSKKQRDKITRKLLKVAQEKFG